MSNEKTIVLTDRELQMICDWFILTDKNVGPMSSKEYELVCMFFRVRGIHPPKRFVDAIEHSVGK